MRAFQRMFVAGCVLAAPIALAAAAAAAELYPGMTVYNAAGQPVGVVEALPSAAGASTVGLAPNAFAEMGFPNGIFAAQAAMMHQAMAQMQAMNLFMTAGPARTIQAAMEQMMGNGRSLPQSLPPGVSEVSISTFGGGHGSCSETLTYRDAATGAQPVVAVHKVGDACGTMAMPQLREVPAAAHSSPAHSSPAHSSPARPDGLLRVDDQVFQHG